MISVPPGSVQLARRSANGEANLEHLPVPCVFQCALRFHTVRSPPTQRTARPIHQDRHAVTLGRSEFFAARTGSNWRTVPC